MPQPLSTPGKDPVPIVQEAGWAPGLVWTGVGNLTPTEIQSLDCPARSQSLYQLSYPAHQLNYAPVKIYNVYDHLTKKKKLLCSSKAVISKKYTSKIHSYHWYKIH
jgi:hypothetical protein